MRWFVVLARFSTLSGGLVVGVRTSATHAASIAQSRYRYCQFDASFSLGRLHTLEMAWLFNEAEVMHASDMPLNGHGLEVTFQIDSFVLNVFKMDETRFTPLGSALQIPQHRHTHREIHARLQHIPQRPARLSKASQKLDPC